MLRVVAASESWEGEAGSGVQVNTTHGFDFSLNVYILLTFTLQST